MSQLTPGKIFLADQRGLTENEKVSLHSTLNFGSFFSEHKQPLGSLYVFNDISLAALQSAETVVDKASYVILMPITGALVCQATGGQSQTADVGEVYITTVIAQEKITVTNPYEGDTISYLQIHIQADVRVVNGDVQSFEFDLQGNPNQLIEVIGRPLKEIPFTLCIGMFAGREEALYTPEADALLFAFVITGAFEMQGRLLHNRDGLALWGAPEADLEALSNNAVMLLLELPAANS